MLSEEVDESANQVKIIERWVAQLCQEKLICFRGKKKLKNNIKISPPSRTHTSRLQATKLCAANEILKEDISLIKTHKGHP